MGVRITRFERVMLLELDRVAKANAIDPSMTAALDAALNELEDEPRFRVGVLAARGPVFCAGSDLELGSGAPTPRGGEYGLIRRRSTTPLIAAVEAPAYGGGFELVLACDLVVATSDAAFALPEVRRGVIASSGALVRVHRALPLNLAKELLLTGRELGAQEAARHGFVNRLVAPGEALKTALALAEELLAGAPTATTETLRVLDTVLRDPEDEGWEATEAAVERVLASEDRREGIDAFFAGRAPNWPGA